MINIDHANGATGSLQLCNNRKHLSSNAKHRGRLNVLLLTFIAFIIYSGGIIYCFPYMDFYCLPFLGFMFLCMMIIFVEFNGDLFNPILQYLLILQFTHSIVPLIAMATDPDIASAIKNPMAVAIITSIYSSLSVIFLYLGYKSPFGVRIEKIFPVSSDNFSKKKVMLFIILASSASVISILYLIHIKGGLLLFSMALSNRIILFMNYGYLYELVKLSHFALYVFFIFSFLKTKKTVLISGFFLIVLFVAIIVTLLTGSRGDTINIFITLMFIYNYYVKRVKWRTLLVPILFFSFFFYMAGEIRSQLGGGILEGSKLELNNSFFKHITISGEGFITAMKLIENVPDNVGFYMGKTYIEAPLALIPRSLYPNKPVGASWEMNKIISDNEFKYTTDLSVGSSGSGATLFHESYLNFGVFGVIVAFFVQGICYRAYYCYICNNSKNRFALLFGVYLFSLISIGDSFGHVIKLFTTIVTILLFYCFASKSPRSLSTLPV